MKLYGFPLSPNTRKVQALALHLGIPLEIQVVNLLAGEQKNPDYLKINPAGRTPTLVDDGIVLPESNAIMQYIAAKAGDNPVWPKDEKQRALINARMCWQLDHWNRACNLLTWENMLKKLFNAGDPDSAEVKRGEQLFNTFAGELNSRLKGRDYLVGNNLTLADYAVAAPLEYAEAAHFPMGAYGDIRRWYAGIAKLDAWRKTAPQGGAA